MPEVFRMTNPFYVDGRDRAAKVAELFGGIAHRYDLLNDIQSLGLHRFWKRRLVALADLHRGDRALDVCCGTGDIAFRLAKGGARVTGLDFSEAMLAVARRRAEASGPAGSGGGVELVRGDAMDLPFPDGTFAAVTVGYGLRNVREWRGALGEMIRVAQPGGRILVLDFGKPDNRLLRALYFSYLRVVVPLCGLLFCGNAAAYAYILESLHHYPAQNGVRDEMERCGLESVGVLHFFGGAMTINHGVKPKRAPCEP